MYIFSLLILIIFGIVKVSSEPRNDADDLTIFKRRCGICKLTGFFDRM